MEITIPKDATKLSPADLVKQEAIAAEASIVADKEKLLSAAKTPAPAPAAVPEGEKVFNIYHCTRPTMHMHTPDGHDIRFAAYRCITDNPKFIEYLDSEIAAGNRNITVNPEKLTVTSADLDPMNVIKRQAVKEYLAEQAAAVVPVRDLGSTPSGGAAKVIPSTDSIAVVSGDSNSGSK